jgi:hypothetical protein
VRWTKRCGISRDPFRKKQSEKRTDNTLEGDQHRHERAWPEQRAYRAQSHLSSSQEAEVFLTKSSHDEKRLKRSNGKITKPIKCVTSKFIGP